MFGIRAIETFLSSAVRSVVGPVEKALAAPVDTFVDGTSKPTWASFSGAAQPVAPAADSVAAGARQADGDFLGGDGKAYSPSTPLSLIPPVMPRAGNATGPTIIYVNGAFDGEAEALDEMHSVADTTQSPVIGVYNAHENLLADVVHVAEDMLDAGDRPAADTIAQLVYETVKAGQPVVLYGHSQGGAILSRALDQVIARLETQDGLSPAEAERQMAVVHVETFAAAGYDFPDGPQYVHYVNEYDPVPRLLGIGVHASFVHPGRGAVIHTASIEPSNPFKVHSMQLVYMPMWKAVHDPAS